LTDSKSDHVLNLWPLSRTLFELIIDDRITDAFVCQLIWERLGYELDDF